MLTLLRNLAIACLALSFAAPTVQAVSEGNFLVSEGVQLDRSKVRHGNLGKFDPEGTKTVGTVRSTDVYEQIPAYQTIQKEGLKKGSARYNKLIRAATRNFKAALKKVAGEKSLVLIVEEGGISGYAHVTDATSDIIAAI